MSSYTYHHWGITFAMTFSFSLCCLNFHSASYRNSYANTQDTYSRSNIFMYVDVYKMKLRKMPNRKKKISLQFLWGFQVLQAEHTGDMNCSSFHITHNNRKYHSTCITNPLRLQQSTGDWGKWKKSCTGSSLGMWIMNWREVIRRWAHGETSKQNQDVQCVRSIQLN